MMRVNLLLVRREYRRPRRGSRNKPSAMGDSLLERSFGDPFEASLRVATFRMMSVGPPVFDTVAGEKV
jgi:hypothetical protein